jgi:hypothetical protein
MIRARDNDRRKECQLEQAADPDASRGEVQPVDSHVQLRFALLGGGVAVETGGERERERADRKRHPGRFDYFGAFDRRAQTR